MEMQLIISQINKKTKEKYEECVNPLTSLEIETLLYETFRTKNIEDLLSKYTISEIIKLLELQMVKDCEWYKQKNFVVVY